MNRILLILLALLTSCTEGPWFINCTEDQIKEGMKGVEFTYKFFPGSKDIMKETRISCELFDPYPGSECVTWKLPKDGNPGLMEVRIDLVGVCILHEGQHYELRYEEVEDGCQSHLEECGWDKFLLEESQDALNDLLMKEQ